MQFIVLVFLITNVLAFTSSNSGLGVGKLLELGHQKIGNFNLKTETVDYAKLPKENPTKLILSGYIAPDSAEFEVIFFQKKIEQKTFVLKLWVTKKPLCLGSNKDCKIISTCPRDLKKIMKKFEVIIPTETLLTEINAQLKKSLLTAKYINPQQLLLKKNFKDDISCSKSIGGHNLIARQIEINGEMKDIAEIFKDPSLSQLVTNEGPYNLTDVIN